MTASPAPSAGSGVASFEALLLPLLKPAYALALRLTGDPHDAEDVLQDAALRALRGFGSFQPGTNFRAWFYRVLTNSAFERHRRNRRSPATVDLDDVPELYLFQRTAEAGLHAGGDDPAAALMARLSAEQVQAALAALPDEHRAVAALFFLEDASYEEIAETLGIPIGTVRSRLHRGRRLLQKTLWQQAVDAGIVRP